MRKPWQLVTVDNKVYRAKRTTNPLSIVHCDMICDIYNNSHQINVLCNKLRYNLSPKLGDGLFLRRIQCRDKSVHK
jgi:hypothetical protein